MQLCKKDRLFKDAMVYACESRDADTAEELVRHFVQDHDDHDDHGDAEHDDDYEYVDHDIYDGVDD